MGGCSDIRRSPFPLFCLTGNARCMIPQLPEPRRGFRAAAQCFGAVGVGEAQDTWQVAPLSHHSHLNFAHSTYNTVLSFVKCGVFSAGCLLTLESTSEISSPGPVAILCCTLVASRWFLQFVLNLVSGTRFSQLFTSVFTLPSKLIEPLFPSWICSPSFLLLDEEASRSPCEATTMMMKTDRASSPDI